MEKYVRCIVRGSAAEDAAGVAATKALKAFRERRLPIFSIMAWMFKTARRDALAKLRRDRAREKWERLAARQLECHECPFEGLVRSETQELIRSALAELEVAEQEILKKCGIDELSYRQAARDLGLTPDSARKLLARAKRRFQAALWKWGIQLFD